MSGAKSRGDFVTVLSRYGYVYDPFDSVLYDSVLVQESLSVQEPIEILLVHDNSFSAV